ncbi:MAG TPA: hypothetical protein DCF45_08180, partial [Gammaproteobacteria bacterium]|nr:hypothetical protein [Gammaproteobacteria bacterium]
GQPTSSARRDSAKPPRHQSSELCGSSDRAVIIHNGDHYLLRITRNGKLILTK